MRKNTKRCTSTDNCITGLKSYSTSSNDIEQELFSSAHCKTNQQKKVTDAGGEAAGEHKYHPTPLIFPVGMCKNTQGMKANGCLWVKAWEEVGFCAQAHTKYSSSAFLWSSILSSSLPPNSPEPFELVHVFALSINLTTETLAILFTFRSLKNYH